MSWRRQRIREHSAVYGNGTPNGNTGIYGRLRQPDAGDFEELPGYDETFLLIGRGSANSMFGGFKMKPWDEREISQFEVEPLMQQAMSRIPGVRISVFPRPPIPGAGNGLPLQFVITSGKSYEEIDTLADELLGSAMASGNFMFLQKSIEIDRPINKIVIDRDRAADLGLSMGDVGLLAIQYARWRLHQPL